MSDNNLPLTAEERRVIAAVLTELAMGTTCPWCHATITEKKQVGRCIYAMSCGCRLSQGQLKKGRKEP